MNTLRIELIIGLMLVLFAWQVCAVEDNTMPGGQWGYYDVTSTPSGAMVSMDGLVKGTTPVKIQVSTTGTPGHTFEISLSGYQKWEKKVDGNPGYNQVIPIVAELVPSNGGFILVNTVPSGAVVTLDGVQKLLSPAQFQVTDPFYHNIQVNLQGYQTYTNTTSVNPGEKTTLTVNLVPNSNMGSITLTSTPSGADIYIDNTFSDQTPATISQLSAGVHTLTLKLAGYQTLTKPVTISAMNTITADFPLQQSGATKSGYIAASSTPPNAAVYVDGNYEGLTPSNGSLDITDITPGQHSVVFRMAGYIPYSIKIDVGSGRTTIVTGVLNDTPEIETEGNVFIETIPSGSDVFIDNQYKGISPVFLSNITIGSHSVLARLTGYSDFTQAVQITSGKTIPVIARLQPLVTSVPTTVATTQKSPVSLILAPFAFIISGLVIIFSRRK